MSKELYILMGLPRSGKSSYSKELEDIKVIEVDEIRKLLTNSVYNEDLEPVVFDKARDLVIHYLSISNKVLIDESNPSIQLLDYWIEKIKIHFKVNITIVYICTSVEVCLSRTKNKNLKSAIIRKSTIMPSISDVEDYCNLHGYKLILPGGL